MKHEIIMRDVETLIPYARNARTHSPAQVAQIMGSIKEFGFTAPVLIHGNGILAGHGRVQAARGLGMAQVPTIDLSHLTKTQARAYILADNQLALNAGWESEMLSLELAELKDEGFDLDLLGFDDLDGLMNPEEAGGLAPCVDEDAVPEAPKVAITKPGDIITLGRHRLMCGNSTDEASVYTLMDGGNADLVFTDPPYLIQTEGGCKGEMGDSLRKQGKSIEFIADFNPADFLKVLPTVFPKGKMNAYIFCNKELLPDYLNWARDSKVSFNVLIWKKPNAIPIGDSHRPDIEYLLLFRKAAIWNNGLPGVNYSRCIEQGRETGLHPTMKPVSLIENEMVISSNKGSIVLDLFGGSGSTMIAAEKTGRTAYLMELDPIYCDVIVTRWEQTTGKKATR